ncbi:permease [Alginatibacterium sediminis]|uniref:Permease n=2 Tax=Alginatibacterium sediminis TaxID=2164068 RepID=A0A420E7C6_9ALTE|nr:permease [Alginatibacterium sediminis]
MNNIIELSLQFWLLFLDSAPWLLFGLIIAGWIKVFVPLSWMQQQLGAEGFTTTVKAAVLGAPLPLCSCGVIPAALGLRRSGASKSATTAFLVATPETGVDSVSMTYVLLGPVMAIVRPIAAISSAIVAGVLVGRDSAAAMQTKESSQQSCCASQAKQAPTQQAVAPPSVFRSAITGLHYAANNLIRDTTPWLLVGLLFAAIVNTFIPDDFLSAWGSGFIGMLVMIVISIPMYICATASTPIAAGLLLSGVSPGAVLVFMLAGPATNIASLGLVRSELGNHTLVAYLTGVIGTAVLFGLGLDALVATMGWVIAPLVGPENRVLPLWLSSLSAFILGALIVHEFGIKHFYRKHIPNHA